MENTDLKHLNDSKDSFELMIEHLNDMDDIYKNIGKQNPNKKRKILTVFDDMLADMLSIKTWPNSNWIFFRDKLNICLVFIRLILLCHKILDKILYTIWKFHLNKNFDKLHLIIQQILTYKSLHKMYSKIISFLVHVSLASDNSLRFWKNLSERIYKLIMIIDDEIRDEKLLYDIAEKQLKISALSSGKIDRYEYLTGEEILPSNQRQITETNKNDSILKRKTEINKKNN